MNEMQKKARIKVVAYGLSYLVENRRAMSRKELFAAVRGQTLTYHEVDKKGWQQPVLDRLIEQQLLKSTDDGELKTYSIDNEQSVRLVLENYEAGGTALAAFVFPNEVPMQDLRRIAGAAEIALESMEKTDPTNDPELVQKAADDLQRLLDAGLKLPQGKTLDAAVIDETRRRAALAPVAMPVPPGALPPEANELVTELHSQRVLLTKLHALVDNIEGGLVALSEALAAKMVPAINHMYERVSRVDEATSGVKKRLDAIDDRMVSMQQASEAQASRTKDIVALGTTLSESMKSLDETISRLTAVVQHSDRDRLAELVTRFDRMMQESESLRQMLLDVATTPGTTNGVARP